MTQAQKRYWKTKKGRATQKKYHQSLKGKLAVQSSASRLSLKLALKIKSQLRDGWPDALNIEQKVGCDSISVGQWRRAAKARSRGIIFKLVFGTSYEDIVYNNQFTMTTFAKYARKLKASEHWNRLVKSVK